jgi:DNA-binding transcriptional regulator YhcF (GntR family)
MANKYWIRLYHELLDDPKVGRLSDNLWRRFIECCLLAGENNKNGRLPSVSDISWRLRISTETIEADFDSLSRAGLLEYRAEEVFNDYWFVTNFEKRQKAMSKAEYMRRKREKQECYQPVTIGNTEEEKEEEKEEERLFSSLSSKQKAIASEILLKIHSN